MKPFQLLLLLTKEEKFSYLNHHHAVVKILNFRYQRLITNFFLNQRYLYYIFLHTLGHL